MDFFIYFLGFLNAALAFFFTIKPWSLVLKICILFFFVCVFKLQTLGKDEAMFPILIREKNLLAFSSAPSQKKR